MTKEEKIQEAWGDVWKELPALQKEGALKHDGWVSHPEYRLGYSLEDKYLVKKLYNISKKEEWLVCDQFTFRPVSLSGIENNNGWVKIESVEDLPKLTVEFYVIKNGSLINAYYTGNNRWLTNESPYRKTTKLHGITHYQPIEKPKPPIY